MAKINIKFGKKRILVRANKVSLIGRAFGLMFKSRSTDNLLFLFRKDVYYKIHSLFVFFPFLIIWLDDKNNVLEWNIVPPFRTRIQTPEKYRKFVEIPLNSKNKKIISFFVGSRKI